MSSMAGTSGVYFLANDRVLNWSIAFLESVRAHEPDMRLVMIPFDQKLDAMTALSSKYCFEIFDHPSLAALDAVGKSFFPTWEVWQRTFRKFAVFWGPLERFIFSDVDIVHLEGLGQYAEAFDRSQLDLLYSDEDMRQVYERENLRQNMVQLNNARGFNTGFWTSRRGLFTLERIEQIAEQARPIAWEFNQGTYEQPFFNYCFDVSRLRYAQFAEFMPELTRVSVAAHRGIKRDADGSYRIGDATSPENGKRITFLHWAGTPATPVMPYRSIFLQYRLRSEPAWRKIAVRIAGAPRALMWQIIRFCRSAGLISKTYKRWMPMAIQSRVSKHLHQK